MMVTMLCGFRVEDLIAVAEMLQANPKFLDNAKLYCAGYVQGYNAAIDEAEEQLRKRLKKCYSVEQPFEMKCEFEPFKTIPKRYYNETMQDQALVEHCRRLYMEKVVMPNQRVFMRTEGKDGNENND